MIMGTDSGGQPGFLQEYSNSSGDAFLNIIGQTFQDNFSTRLFQHTKLENATGKFLSNDEAKELVHSAGLNFPVPEAGINEGALSIMIDRQYQKKVREEAIEAADPSLVLRLGGSLIGGLLDPLNIALSFVPFAGQAKYLSLMAGAAGPIERMGLSAGYGAVQGTIGAAAIEPVQRYMADHLGDDDDNLTSLMNVAFGSLFVGLMHGTTQAGAELYKFYKNSKAPSVSQAVTHLSPEVRVQMAKAAIAQSVEDRPVNVTPILEGEKKAVNQHIAQLENELKSNPQDAHLINAEIERLRQQNPDLHKMEPVMLEGQLRELLRQEDGSFIDSEGNVWPKEKVEGALLEQQKNSPETSQQTQEPKLADVQEQLDEAMTQPGEKFLNEELVTSQAQEVKNAPKNLDLEEAGRLAKEAVADLEDLAKEFGIEAKDLKIMEDAAQGLKKADEMAKGLEAMARCLLRKGI
jgi:hypothetical protein